MSVEPMQFLAEALETARERGVLDIEVGSEREAAALRLQFYNLIRKCRRLLARGGKSGTPAAPVVGKIVEDAELIMLALPRDLPGTLRFCRPEYSPTAKVMMGAIGNSASGRELLERIEARKSEAQAIAEAQAAAIRESELRQLAGMAGEVKTIPEAEAAVKSRMAKYLGEG